MPFTCMASSGPAELFRQPLGTKREFGADAAAAGRVLH